ncbi:MAG: hypothetical protein FWD21_01610 [Peptococcaceae bacterium]|nr:hypothetical protein [Peptococcaceae bacterium]
MFQVLVHMKLFGNKKMFAIEYEMEQTREFGCGVAELRVFINNKSVCTFMNGDNLYEYQWDIRDTVEWLANDLAIIIKEEKGFPLPVVGSNANELYENSHLETEDDEELDNWYGKRNDWFYHHSWLSSRAGGPLADLVFRRVGNMIEISWDNRELYEEDNVEFVNPVGVFCVEIDYLEKLVTDFVNAFNEDLKNNS